MDITAAFLLLFVFILLYTAIIEIFTTLFRLLGMVRDKARTQVISLLTNSGFTTSESEVVLSSRKRRKLAQITMLFGYSFTVIIVSTIVNVFLSLSKSELNDVYPVVGIICISVILFLILSHIKPVRALLDRYIERVGNRIMFGPKSNPMMLVDVYGANAIVEVLLKRVAGDILDVPLVKTGLREEFNIHILHIKRKKEDFVKINGETVLQSGDIVLLFGNYKNIRTIFERVE